MANRILEEIYNQLSNIESQKLEKGVLYKTIQIVLREDQLTQSQKAVEICDYFGINTNASRFDDEDFLLNHVFYQLFIPIPEPVTNLLRLFHPREKQKMDWLIVIGACALVGLYFYTRPQNQRNGVRDREVNKLRPSSLPIPANLCLVVPASVISHFRNNSVLTVNDVMSLIDDASYFLCTTVRSADSYEKDLEMTDEPLPSESRREVYIRINVADGRNLIDKKLPYLLKTNLPVDTKYVVERLACLKNFSGLEAFNRV